VQQADQLLEELGHAVARGAATEIRQLAHRWGGSSSTCGAAALAGSLQRLEAMALSGAISSAPSAFDETVRQWARVRNYLLEQGTIASGGAEILPATA
jgi:HPt (histidine-containing phosphotransfer) domain-containing protein